MDKLKFSRAQNPQRVAWHLLHVQAGNDNYINLAECHMHAMLLKLKLRGHGCTSLEVSHLWSSD